MITIKDVKTLDGKIIDYSIPSPEEHIIDAQKRLVLLPGVIDTHTCFGPPTQETWKLAVQAAIKGGITSIINVPYDGSTCLTKAILEQKKQTIETQLSELNLPLHYHFYTNANFQNPDECGRVKSLSYGMFIGMDSDAVEDASWNRLFQLAAWDNLPIVINARKETLLLEKALHYTQKHAANLYVLNVAIQQELKLIQEARQKSLLVYAETTPQHLFPKDASNVDFLWEAVNNGFIDTIGSGYHWEQPWFGTKPSDLSLFLPLLLNAAHENKISLDKIVHLTSKNIKEIFRFERSQDFVLVDLEKRDSSTKLIGSQVHTIVNGHLIEGTLSSLF